MLRLWPVTKRDWVDPLINALWLLEGTERHWAQETL